MKGSFKDHLEKLGMVLDRLRQAGLKVNAKKSFLLKMNQNIYATGLLEVESNPLLRKSML